MLQLILRWVAQTHWLIPVMKRGTSNWFYEMTSFYFLPPTMRNCVTICLSPPYSPPSYDHPLVFLTGSVPICLPRYLIPCNHMMLSQRRVVRERDCYSVSAAKILALTPSCCSPDHSPPPLRQLDSILFSKGAETPNSNSNDTGKRPDIKGPFCPVYYSLDLMFTVLEIISMGYTLSSPKKSLWSGNRKHGHKHKL